jgi:hypothetical protein
VKLALQRRILPAIALALIIGLSQFAPALAATTAPAPTSKTNNANSMSISPLRTDLTVSPGESKKVTVYITNLTDGTVTLQAIENDFVAGDENGTPAIILDKNSFAPTHSLKRFMVPIPDVTIGPKKTVPVDVTINVPITAQAGGYFGAVRFAPAKNDAGPVNLSSSVASLILLTVPGPTVEKLVMTNFDIRQKDSSGSNFRTPEDLNVFVRFENKGNLQQAPFGQVAVLKGKKVVYSHKFNQEDPKAVVLPDSARGWTVPLKNIGKFGKYTVNGTFGYGNGQTVQVEKTVWIVPTSYILGAVGVILALILFIWFMRSYRRRVLRSARYRRR